MTEAALKGNDGRPSPRFAFFERYDIHDWADPTDVYLRRWRIIDTPWFGIFLHKIMRPDHDRALHDHPYSFFAIMLRRGYEEEVRYETTTGVPYTAHFTKRFLSWSYRRAEQLHRIAEIRKGGPAWTLLFHGRRRRQWGFSPEPGIWIEAPTYINENFPG